MIEQKYKVTKDGAVGRITLSNPDKHNAFDDELIKGLTGAFTLLGNDEEVRVVVLAADGKSFSAGADLNWMKRMAGYDRAENLEDSRALAQLMKVINFLPKPVIGLVQGAAYGGGVGLVACCDIVIASDRASFCLSETKLGLIPAVISPYVVSAIGAQAARRYFLTAERFDAVTAHRLGLIHEMVTGDALELKGEEIIRALLAAGPNAVGAAKDLIFAVDRPISAEVIEDTANRIADIRASDEGKEGLSAFLEKRKPAWVEGDN
ncbi:enoyl-CoA hydratase/isomerase family protein [Aestuariispira insulae]|uniref:Methylglutaconyl-CoA hydratase n=1 Tax=Aestuariispira insulae TaxID=1461337 RepID=A0A3D9HSX1_9PROT|nr:enoyl-CoA hydratase/isomerase family protein [Aestuariispira insulae]RED52549.1 methylglutaconyl-CoA hydratase [Aestuariispira insulae]